MGKTIFSKQNKCLVIDYWILSYLYENDSVTRKDILKNLCQASFELMEKPEQYSDSINSLLSSSLIQTNRSDIENLNVEFSITETGIIEYRKNIVNPFVYMKKNLPERLESDDSPSGIFLKELSKCTILEVSKLIVRKILENAPIIVEIWMNIQSTGVT